MRTLITTLLLGLTLSSTQGCVSYQGDELPRTKGVGALKPIADDFSFHYHSGHHHGGEYHEHGEEGDYLQFVTERAVKRLNVYNTKALRKARLQIEISHHEDSSTILSLLSGLTLFLIPSYSVDELTVKATLLEGGEEIASAETHSSVNTIFQFFILFYMPFSDGYVLERNVRYLNEEAIWQVYNQVLEREEKED